MRVFIAVTFPDLVKAELQNAQVPFRLNRQRGNFTSYDNFHLTLVFIGEATRQDLEVLEDAIESIEFKPFELKLGSLGSFPSKDGVIWWVGLQHDPRLFELQAQIVEALHKTGLSFEDKRYKPHVTLVRSFKPARPDQTLILPAVKPLTIPVMRISLMKSERIHDELTYTEIYQKELSL